ncbi:MAG: hypothetical protein A3G24_24270 [Betaproteobacteria bacterium RIFCSPLOWO2_12_FULL_62_13]|nr:MAG: hypothetical protein A3G24_24270 [Betaproteobacteria bacterium RIFCSPLOWO2_12_FULL_62_13]
MMRIQSLSIHADHLSRWCAVALGFSIPISVAADNVLLVLIAGTWLASGRYRDKLRLIRDHPLSRAALLLFALLALGTAYGVGAPADARAYLGKYADLLFVPILLWIFRDPAARRSGVYAFSASLLLVLLLSFLMKFGALPAGGIFHGDSSNPVAFKQYLTHNILIAYGAFVFTQLAAQAATPCWRRAWIAAALLSAFNVVFMVPGRTGLLVLCALALYAGYRAFAWRGLAVAAASVAALGIALVLVPGVFPDRLQVAAQEFAQWQSGKPAQDATGLRLEFYRNTLSIIADHPLLGVGTGGFPKAYADKVSGTGMAETRNPHNEFLHITAQLGIAGLAALLWLFWQQWRCSAELATPLEGDLARGLVMTMTLGCMFNSLLLDHTEGLLYAWLTGLLYGGLKSGDG